MVGTLADRFGWTFAEIGMMTFPQVKAALGYIRKHPAPWVYLAEPSK